MRDVYKMLFTKSDWKRLDRKPVCKWEVILKLVLKEQGVRMWMINLAQDRVQWQEYCLD
jgi:hypothetical protein